MPTEMGCFHLSLIISILTSVHTCYGSKVITTSLGKVTTLPCELDDLASGGILSLYWRKDGTTIYSNTTNGEVGQERYSIIDASSLVIPDVTESDAGNYSCKIVSRSFQTGESEITQLYVTDITVSHCKNTKGAECSCTINGSNITSLECSASGFPYPPEIAWEVGHVTYRSSSLDLTMFTENLTVVCKPTDRNIDIMGYRTVCVYYVHDVPDSPTAMPTSSTSTPSTSLYRTLFVLLLIVCLCLCVVTACQFYKRKKGSSFHLPFGLSRFTSTPKSQQEASSIAGKRPLEPMTSYDAGDVNVHKDSWKHSKVNNFGSDVSDDMPSRDISVIEGETDDVDFPPKDCNKDIVLISEMKPALPLVGQVLLDDLGSATEVTRGSLMSVIVALLSKRKEPYENDQSHIEPNISVQSSFMNTPLQNSVKMDPDMAFVHMVLDDLDQILDARDRDECEILITKPDFRDITDESQIPTYQGNRVIQQSCLGNSYRSPSTPANMTSTLTSSMVSYTSTPLSPVLESELRKKITERTAMRNSISKIILDCMVTGYSKRGIEESLISRSTGGLFDISLSPYVNIEAHDDEVSRLVTFWMTKTAKLGSKVNKDIKGYLFPLKQRNGNINESLGADSGIHSSKEEYEIPQTTKLLDSNS